MAQEKLAEAQKLATALNEKLDIEELIQAIKLVSRIKKRTTSKFVKHDVGEALDWLRRAEVAAEDVAERKAEGC
jgi:hypothetical protein